MFPTNLMKCSTSIFMVFQASASYRTKFPVQRWFSSTIDAGLARTTTSQTKTKSKLGEESQLLLKSNNKFLRGKKRNPPALYILERNIAANLAEKLYPKLQKESTMLFEINPGSGVLTEVLLEMGVKKVRLFQWQDEFLSDTELLKTKYGHRVEVLEHNLFELPKIIAKDIYYQSASADALFHDVKIRTWNEEEVPLQIFGILPSSNERSFLSYLTRSVTNFSCPFHIGRTEFYLFVSGKEYAYLTATPHENFWKYKSNTVLMQIFFDLELLHVEPRSSFYPLLAERKSTKFDLNNLYLMQVTPKRFLFDLIPRELVTELYYFVQQHMIKPTQPIIPALEHWLPGCGLHFLKQGLRMHTRFGDLTPNQLLMTFLQFSMLPEYSSCLFRAAANDACVSVLYKDDIDVADDHDKDEPDGSAETKMGG